MVGSYQRMRSEHESGADAVAREICELACKGGDLAAFRREALARVLAVVPADAALFHELSPRVPLVRAAAVGIDLAAVERSRGSWDELAVVLGSLRDHALARGGVAVAREAFARSATARTAWSSRVAPMLGAREAMLTHLVVDSRIVSAVLLARRRGTFAAHEQAWMRALVPSLAVADAMRQMHEDGRLHGLAADLRCVDGRLTERQRELVLLVALGNTDAQIAEALALSANTVRNHLAQVRARLGAANRAEIVRLAVLR